MSITKLTRTGIFATWLQTSGAYRLFLRRTGDEKRCASSPPPSLAACSQISGQSTRVGVMTHSLIPMPIMVYMYCIMHIRYRYCTCIHVSVHVHVILQYGKNCNKVVTIPLC